MKDIDQLLQNNKAWVANKLSEDPSYFEESAKGQSPSFLWIGCSDSRVPAEDITGTQPGELFVHRNVANMVIPTDLNANTALVYGVDHLKVNHIIVCGHYGCGGVRAAVSRKDLGILNKWLRHIKDVYRLHETELDAISNEDQRVDRLVELNVIEQTRRLVDSDFIQRAWRSRQAPTLHGWIYDLRTGQLKDLVTVKPGETEHDIYTYVFD
jgi:carbonic anhydrase